MPDPRHLLVVLLAAPLGAQTQFVTLTPAAVAVARPMDAVAADFDGDGDLDLFTCTSLAGLFAGQPGRCLLRNDGDEQFTNISATALPPQAGLMANGRTVAADFDGDGDVDVFGAMTGGVIYWRNVGGTFVDTGFTDTGGYTDLVAADLDGDGDADIAASGQPLAASTNTLFVNQGTGTFVRANVLPLVWGISIAATDLDGDGDRDLLLSTTTGLLVLRNGGGLLFTDVSAAWVSGLVPGAVREFVAGDLDGDGDPDLVVARQGAASDDVLLNSGGTFVAGASLPAVASSIGLALADIDEDADLDLWRGGTGGIELLLGSGTGGFTSGASRHGPLGAQSPVLLPFDFDRDGDLDLLVCEPFLPPVLLANRHRDLRPGQPVIGQPWQPSLWSQPGYAATPHLVTLGIALFELAQPVALAGVGELALDFAGPVALFAGATPVPGYAAVFALTVPNAPPLVGLPLHLQGLIDAPPSPPRLSAWFTVQVQ
ncbi:MAG: VCBS repeat-containing protein [Planctomycetota bacterium]